MYRLLPILIVTKVALGCPGATVKIKGVGTFTEVPMSVQATAVTIEGIRFFPAKTPYSGGARVWCRPPFDEEIAKRKAEWENPGPMLDGSTYSFELMAINMTKEKVGASPIDPNNTSALKDYYINKMPVCGDSHPLFTWKKDSNIPTSVVMFGRDAETGQPTIAVFSVNSNGEIDRNKPGMVFTDNTSEIQDEIIVETYANESDLEIGYTKANGQLRVNAMGGISGPRMKSDIAASRDLEIENQGKVTVSGCDGKVTRESAPAVGAPNSGPSGGIKGKGGSGTNQNQGL